MAAEQKVKPEKDKAERVPPQPLKTSQNVWRLEEHASARFQAFAHKSVEVEDLKTNPTLWHLVSPLIAPYDRITVIREDHAWWAECLVLDAHPGYARVLVLRHVDLPASVEQSVSSVPAGYRIYQDKVTRRYVAEREGTGARMNGHGSRSFDEALAALLAHNSITQAVAPATRYT